MCGEGEILWKGFPLPAVLRAFFGLHGLLFPVLTHRRFPQGDALPEAPALAYTARVFRPGRAVRPKESRATALFP